MMRPVKQQRKGKSYLHGILRDGVSCFSYRNAVSRLLSIPASVLNGRHQAGLSVPLNFKYRLNNTVYQPQVHKAGGMPEHSVMPAYEKVVPVVPDTPLAESHYPADPVIPETVTVVESKIPLNADSIPKELAHIKTLGGKRQTDDIADDSRNVETDKPRPTAEHGAEQTAKKQKPADPYAFIRQLSKQLEAENFGENNQLSQQHQSLQSDKPSDTDEYSLDVTHLTVPTMSAQKNRSAVQAQAQPGSSNMAPDLTGQPPHDFSQVESQLSIVERNYQQQKADSIREVSATEYKQCVPGVDHSNARHEEARHYMQPNAHLAQMQQAGQFARVAQPKDVQHKQQVEQTETVNNTVAKPTKRTVQTVKRRAIRQKSGANAFLERSYLGRTHLRIFR